MCQKTYTYQAHSTVVMVGGAIRIKPIVPVDSKSGLLLAHCCRGGGSKGGCGDESRSVAVCMSHERKGVMSFSQRGGEKDVYKATT